MLDEGELADLGCGGILGVGQGSDNPPRLVRLEYRPKDAPKQGGRTSPSSARGSPTTPVA